MIPVPLAAEEGGFHVPPMQELFEFRPFLFEDSQFFAFNRFALLTLLVTAILTVLVVAAFRNPQVVPSKFQSIMEAIVSFIRDYIAIEVIGPDGLRFVPFLTTLFLFIWLGNFFEVMPGVQFPVTSRMALPAFLAFMVWTVFILVGIKEQGLLRYFKNVAVPGGVPWWILWLVAPIEIVSTFIVRPFTLAVRLFANMVAGHIILSIIFIAANAFLFDIHTLSFNLRGSPLGLVFAFIGGPALVGFEVMVGILQAYIFTILAAVYIASSMHPEH